MSEQTTPAGYSGTPLPKKLGIKPGNVVAVVGGPSNFTHTLGELPEGVTLRNSRRGRFDLLIWFPKSASDLARSIAAISRATPTCTGCGLWMCWPKKSSGVHADLSESLIRQAGLDHGLVDIKIAAIDATWSGLKFTRRKS